MRISELLLWLLLTFGSIFVVSAVLPKNWSDKAKIIFRIVVGTSFFFLIGAYWLTTGEKFDETAYRILLCRMHDFQRCISHRDAEAKRLVQEQLDRNAGASPQQGTDFEGRLQVERERQRLADEARQRETEAERRRQEERERQRVVDEARQREAEAERRRLEERERQRVADEARQRATEAERRLQEQRERQRLADEAREREAEAERRRQEQRELELRSRRFGATAVGRVEATKGFGAATFVDQQSTADAESRALAKCNQEAADCKVVARFSGPGKCVFVAGGNTVTREVGGVRRRTGVKIAGTEAEVLQKCQSDFQECRVFHTRCNSVR